MTALVAIDGRRANSTIGIYEATAGASGSVREEAVRAIGARSLALDVYICWPIAWARVAAAGPRWPPPVTLAEQGLEASLFVAGELLGGRQFNHRS